jgi:hypothetical protein
MNDEHSSPRRNLESLKKEAKRWLAALRDDDPDAHARFSRAIPNPPGDPTLRDVQLALAREHGFDGWSDLKDAVESQAARPPLLAQYDDMADALLQAYRTGTREAMERHHRLTWHRRAWPAMRSYVQYDLGKRPRFPDDDVQISIDDARYLVAIEHGFENWNAVESFARSAHSHGARLLAAKPVRLFRRDEHGDDVKLASSRNWREIASLAESHPNARVDAGGQATDEVLELLCRIPSVAALELGGSNQITDDGLRAIANLPNLLELDLSRTSVTDAGLAAIGDCLTVEVLHLGGTRITDRGIGALERNRVLRDVNLSWTNTGDGAIAALAGKPRLAHFMSGNLVTDSGLAMFHQWPIYKQWHGGEARIALLSYRSAPNQLALRGLFTDRGMQHLRGLDGLFGLNLDDSALALTAAALEPLVSLANLGWLAVDAKDDWMPYIARMPKLRFLGAQDTIAGDDGFVALSKSRSIEHIWGRRCHNLHTRGFTALADMPKLRGLSVSCLNVEDAGIAALPSFPSLRELMPMDVSDGGYRHIGKCEELESLVLMYCRNTTDAATEHITDLRKLSYYFNSYTTITDRTPEVLSTMDSLERITFDACHNLTNAGVAKLARLPKLEELRVSGRGVTPEVATSFPSRVKVFQGGQ